VEATGAGQFTTANLLTALLTTESLVFAAISVSVSVGGKEAFGLRPFPPAAVLVVLAALTISFVGFGAALSWVDLFAGHRWPSGTDAQVGVIALLLAILVQPVFAIAVAVGFFR